MCLGWYLRLLCFSQCSAVIEYALYIISLKTLDLSSGEGALTVGTGQMDVDDIIYGRRRGERDEGSRDRILRREGGNGKSFSLV